MHAYACTCMHTAWAHLEPSLGTNEHPIRAKIDLNILFENSLQGLHAGDLKTAISLTNHGPIGHI